MDPIHGKNFILYIECETLTGSEMIPVCSAKGVQLDMGSKIREVAGPNDAKESYFVYGRNSYSLSLDGFIRFSLEEIKQVFIEVEEKLLEADNKLVTVGGLPVNKGGEYFCLENALMDWRIIKWVFESNTAPIKWRGEALVPSINDSFQTNGLAEFSADLQVTGKIERFHTPAPSNVRKEYQTDTLPAETATFTDSGSDPQTGAWTQRFVADGTYLPTGKFHISIYGDQIDHVIEPGDTLEEIVRDLAAQINAKQYQPLNPPPDVITASADDHILSILFDEQHSASASYVAHTDTLKSVGIAFDSEINYDFYRVKVEQLSGGVIINTWYIDVQGTTPTLILPVGTYQISVSGMGADLQYSDYSETTTITIN